jgi:hypothetical protein
MEIHNVRRLKMQLLVGQILANGGSRGPPNLLLNTKLLDKHVLFTAIFNRSLPRQDTASSLPIHFFKLTSSIWPRALLT